MRTPNPKALIPGAVVIAVLLVAVIALVAAGAGSDGSATSSTNAGAPPPTITLDRTPAEPKLTARERADARHDQAREHTDHDSDEPDEAVIADAPVTTVDTTYGAGALLAALPATTADGWRLEVRRLDARTGITYLTATPVDGRPTTTRAATAAVTRAARSLGDDPDSYRTTVPRSLLTTTERTTR